MLVLGFRNKNSDLINKMENQLCTNSFAIFFLLRFIRTHLCCRYCSGIKKLLDDSFVESAHQANTACSHNYIRKII